MVVGRHPRRDILSSPGAVAELADAGDLKSLEGNLVWVRLPPAPPVPPQQAGGTAPAGRFPRLTDRCKIAHFALAEATGALDGGSRRARAITGRQLDQSMKISILLLAALTLVLVGCTLPGASSPTPFSFPTPDLTLTAMFGGSASPAPAAATSTRTPVVQATLEASATAPEPTARPSDTLAPGTTDTRPNGSPIEARQLGSAPTIDGDLSDWTRSSGELENVVFGASNWSGDSDVSATYYIGWTSDALYLAVRVTDDHLVQVSSGSQMFKGDIVEIQLDRDLEGDFFSNSLSGDDFQIGLSPGNFGSIGPETWRWYPVGQTGLLTSVSIEVSSTTNGYTLEARIPWSTFGLAPSAGDRFGFTLSVSDNDLSGAPVQQSMISSVSSRTLTNPTTWGTLVLGS